MAKTDNRKFEVIFSALIGADGELHVKGAILEASEITRIEHQLEIGAIVEIKSAPKVELKPETQNE